MTPEEYGAFLNTLLEAERAGAKLLSTYLDELPADFKDRESVRAVQLDEARNCAVLLGLLRDSGTTPSPATGNFYEKGLAIRGWPERFAFLNRGQAWVAKRLAKALPEIPDSARAALQEMHDSHLENIRKCETLL
jgi:hypothetical protein